MALKRQLFPDTQVPYAKRVALAPAATVVFIVGGKRVLCSNVFRLTNASRLFDEVVKRAEDGYVSVQGRDDTEAFEYMVEYVCTGKFPRPVECGDDLHGRTRAEFDHWGITPFPVDELTAAIKHNRLSSVKRLIEAGVVPCMEQLLFAINSAYDTPRITGVQEVDRNRDVCPRVVKLLVETADYIPPDIVIVAMGSVTNNALEICRVLTAAGCPLRDLEDDTTYYESTVHKAIRMVRFDLVRFCVDEHNTPVNGIMDDYDNLALYAVECYETRAVDFNGGIQNPIEARCIVKYLYDKSVLSVYSQKQRQRILSFYTTFEGDC